MSRPSVIPLDQVADDLGFGVICRYWAIGSRHKALVLDFAVNVRLLLLVCGDRIVEEVKSDDQGACEMRARRFVSNGVACKIDHPSHTDHILTS